MMVREWGAEKRRMGDSNLWHDEIAVQLGGLDVEAASRISGARFSVLKGQGQYSHMSMSYANTIASLFFSNAVARLERALGQYFLGNHHIFLNF